MTFPSSVFTSRWVRAGLILLIPAGGLVAGLPLVGRAQSAGPASTSQVRTSPQYEMKVDIDYELLTLRGVSRVTVPAAQADPLGDAAFFLFANAAGVGGEDERRKNLVVDSMVWNGQNLPFTLEGAVLRARLPQPQSSPFALDIRWHGVVPKAPPGSGSDMLGALGGDISSLLGMGGQGETKKPKNTDYGLYTYGNGILSLGSFWYPQLAVREAGKWSAAQPEGLGDVAYADESDYRVEISGLPRNVLVVAPGSGFGISQADAAIAQPVRRFQASGLREFAVLMSEDFVALEKDVSVAGKQVRVSSVTTKKSAAKSARALDIAVQSLQIFSRRFGPYNYPNFKVVEAPMRGGAGGMEYSAVVGIASMLYGDMQKQLGGMMTSLNLPGAEGLLQGLEEDAGQTASKAARRSVPPAAAAPADANPMMQMVGGVLGQQQEMMESMFEATISHEVAHQWWAIGVGSDSQRHPFVDESLTNWSAMLYFEDRYGKETAEKMSDLHLKTSFSMGAMMGGGDKAANLPTSAYNNNLQYGAVIYGKGALFYAELRKVMGDAAFFSALRTYYGRYNGGIARPQSLRQIMVTAAPTRKSAIDALYKRWVEGAHGQEDIGGGLGSMLGGLDLQGLLGGLLGGTAAGLE